MAEPKTTRTRTVRKRPKGATSREVRARGEELADDERFAGLGTPECGELQRQLHRRCAELVRYAESITSTEVLHLRGHGPPVDICEETTALLAFARVGAAFQETRERRSGGAVREGRSAIDDAFRSGAPRDAGARLEAIVAAHDLLKLVLFAIDCGDAQSLDALRRAAIASREELSIPQQRALLVDVVGQVIDDLRSGRPSLEAREREARERARTSPIPYETPPAPFTLIEAAMEHLMFLLDARMPSPAREQFERLRRPFVTTLMERAAREVRGRWDVQASWIAASLSLHARALETHQLEGETEAAAVARLTKLFDVNHARHARPPRPSIAPRA